MTVEKVLLSLDVGEPVRIGDALCVITRQIGLDEVLVKDKATGEIRQVKVSKLKPATAWETNAPTQPLELVDEEALKKAEENLAMIRPLLHLSARSRKDVEERAKEVGCHANTLYTLLRLYEPSGLLMSLAPRPRSDKGKKRLDPEIEAIVVGVLEDEYLRRQRRTPVIVYREIVKRCKAGKLTPPHINTLRNRIQALPAQTIMARREGKKKAIQKFSPSEGAFPGATHPLAAVQIDHTRVDIMLVDEHSRQSIGRPWITVAIDVFSRMVLGFYISFDPSGALSTGLCVSHAILPKENFLTKLDIEGEWPCWGIPEMLHFDNAKEFRGTMIERACRQYGINVEFRPAAQPHFGGTIERAYKTLSKEIHALPGTTFSNPTAKGDYDSEGKATFTLAEFEKWLATFIVKAYHQQVHSTIGMTPLAKFKEGILGDKTRPGKGLQPIISDIDRLRMDFMPFEMRTVQDYGIAMDKIHYWHDALRPFVNAPDLENPKKKREFLIRRDPRDISEVWLFDPENHEYVAIPYRDTSRPAVSLWEWREARKLAEEKGRATADEASIFAAHERMREIEAEAGVKTKAARRASTRRQMGLGATTKALTKSPFSESTPSTASAPPANILPFDEMDDLSQ